MISKHEMMFVQILPTNTIRLYVENSKENMHIDIVVSWCYFLEGISAPGVST